MRLTSLLLFLPFTVLAQTPLDLTGGGPVADEPFGATTSSPADISADPFPATPSVVIPEINIPDTSQDIQNVGDKVDQMKNALTSEISSGNEVLNQILQALGASGEDDISREELATALINYEALARIREFQKNLELLYELAPGAMLATMAADNIGQDNGEITTNAMLQALFMRGAVDMNSALQFENVIAREEQRLSEQAEAGEIDAQAYQAALEELRLQGAVASLGLSEAQQFFTQGDLSVVEKFSPAGLLRSDKILNMKAAVNMISKITDPLPAMDIGLSTKLAAIASGEGNVTLTEEEKQKLQRKLLEMLPLAVSNYALSDLASRRMPPPGAPEGENISLQTHIREHSIERFTKKQWHDEIAKASEAALLRELVQMLAFQQWMNYQNFRLQEQQVALMASLNATMSRLASVMDVVKQEYESAVTQAQQSVTEIEQQIQQDFNQNINIDSSIQNDVGNILEGR